ncbi:MAG: DNA alkylation repair protein [Prolixibacteraceae bacterium]|nr:DNA alkylation repair protein [Prolixibacteraceae bacterium]
MEFILDNPQTEKVFKQIINTLPAMQNGITVESMEKMGIKYEKSWGVSIVDLKSYASHFGKNHLLALKLWNKKWRETMILATMLDVSNEVSEEQMDFWVKTSENIEIIEQLVFNLLTETPFAYAKSLEWCRGKKFGVKYAGLLLMGRLAMVAEKDIDEMFESYFDVLTPLAKDKSLSTVFYRSFCQLARRSKYLNDLCVSFAEELSKFEDMNASALGNEIISEITSPDFKLLIKK